MVSIPLRRSARHGGRKRRRWAPASARWPRSLEREGRALRTLEKVRWLLGLTYDDLGARPIDAIRAADILPVLPRGSARTVLRPISENTLNAAFRRMGYGKDEVTAHGFRATASTLPNESGQWNADAIERQLAHVDADTVRRAYARGEHWEERLRMMQWWADKLEGWKGEG